MQLVVAVRVCYPVDTPDEATAVLINDGLLPLLDQLETVDRVPCLLAAGVGFWERIETTCPELWARLVAAVAAGRIEPAGGPMYDAVLSGLPRRDRIGQVVAGSDWIESRLGVRPRCGWVPHQVWEPAMVDDLVEAGLAATILLPDPTTISRGSLGTGSLRAGWFFTESEGRLLEVLPADETLAGLMAAGEVDEVPARLEAAVGIVGPGPVVVAARMTPDQPGGRDLARLLKWLAAGSEWTPVTATQATSRVAANGRFSLPAVGRPGGSWRLERDRDPAASRLHARLLEASRRLAEVGEASQQPARCLLYRAQGAAAGGPGGVPTPPQAQVAYRYLLAAERALDRLEHPEGSWVDVAAEDFDLDGRPEVRVQSDRLTAWIDHLDGRGLYELDLRDIGRALLLETGDGVEGGLAAWLLEPGLTRDGYLVGDGRLQRLAMGPGRATLRRGASEVEVEWAPPEDETGPRLTWRIGIAEREHSVLKLSGRVEGLAAGQRGHLAVELPLGCGMGEPDRYAYGQAGDRLELETLTELPPGDRVGLIEERAGIDCSLEWQPVTAAWVIPSRTTGLVVPHWEWTADAQGGWSFGIRLSYDTSAAQARRLLDLAPRAA